MHRVRSKWAQFIIVDALLIAGFAALVIPGMTFAARAHDLRTQSIPAASEGLVIGTNHHDRPSYYIVFFHTQNGRQAEAHVYDWPGSAMPSRGDRVPIRYVPSKPTEAADARALPGYTLPIVLLGLALCMLVGGGIGLVAMRREFQGKAVSRSTHALPDAPSGHAGL
ncbi:DUF3592 domain-containing protein [Oryzihumus leptocrescens]|uniref:DUF3592 domain-containing protein n=1 Tax=Oryzihumus leptocrescens TaxID=297536 RepID=A0A542ZIX8_9MICO|nr:DUF3592 domain-containing protein [Oryzihumus leptocrescens]TQL60120.1 hypothetical protein FB474_1502 [Oryzihumus leptocrescens]